jgi:hypothetical protein
MSFTSGPPAATYETMPILALAPAVRRVGVIDPCRHVRLDVRCVGVHGVGTMIAAHAVLGAPMIKSYGDWA